MSWEFDIGATPDKCFAKHNGKKVGGIQKLNIEASTDSVHTKVTMEVVLLGDEHDIKVNVEDKNVKILATEPGRSKELAEEALKRSKKTHRTKL
jgi:sporulation protein YlmC with PRC-barrel domain